MKILFRSTAGEHTTPGEKIFLSGYKKPWIILGKDNNGLVKARHSITGCILRLSPGWPCLYDNPGMKETLGIS